MQLKPCRVQTALSIRVISTILIFVSAFAMADDPVRLPMRPGRKNIEIWPPKETDRKSVNRLSLNGWQYAAVKNYDPNAGVPWELQVTPIVENPEGWIPGDPYAGLPSVMDQSFARSVLARTEVTSRKSNRKPEDLTLPVIRLPEIVWPQRFSAEYDNVVGIHFHEYVSDDFARILYSIHKVPPDGPDGKPPANFDGARGSRIEATLLTPVIWSLDQSVMVRDDYQSIPDKARREMTTQSRIDHEVGHAEVSRGILIPGIAGPQDWNPQYCVGRRCNLTWYWKREIIGRSWEGYQRGVGKLKTLRTSIAIVPPTRWSKMLPIPPERITQRHIDEFNREIVQIGGLLSGLDQKAQDEFHSHHGAFEGAGFP